MRIRRSLGPEDFGVSGFECRMATISTMSTLFCQFSCYEVHAKALLHDIALYNELDANGLIVQLSLESSIVDITIYAFVDGWGMVLETSPFVTSSTCVSL